MSGNDISYAGGLAFIDKDPEAELDYSFDWAAWLAEGEAIASHSIIAETPLEVVTSSSAGAVVTAFVRGGVDATLLRLTCRVVTDSTPPRKDDRTLHLRIRHT